MLSNLSFHVDPVLLEMTVQELLSRMTAAENRIKYLEHQLQCSVQYQPYKYGQAQGATMVPCSSPLQQLDMWYPGPFQTPSREAELRSHTFYSPLRGPEPPTTNAGLGNHEDHYTPNLPQAVPIKPKTTANYLPSCSIDKPSLLPSQDVIRKYPKLRGESKAGKLAVKLAREAFFGDNVLVQCTVSGCRDLPALPAQELSELKQTMLIQFPKFWNSPQEFEHLWTTCCESIGQAAKALRRNGF